MASPTLPSSSRVYAPDSAFTGASSADIARLGWTSAGGFGAGYYKDTNSGGPGAPLTPGSGGGGPVFGTIDTTMPQGPAPQLGPYKPDNKGGTFSTGGGAPASGSGGGAPGGSGAGSAGGSPALNALRAQAGMGGGGLTPSVGAASYGDVGAPSIGSPTNPQDAPVAPNTPQTPPPDIPSGQGLMAPGAPRQGLGQRVPPSLAALLKPKVY